MCCCFSVVDVWPCIQTDSGILNVWCKLVIDVMLELVYKSWVIWYSSPMYPYRGRGVTRASWTFITNGLYIYKVLYLLYISSARNKVFISRHVLFQQHTSNRPRKKIFWHVQENSVGNLKTWRLHRNLTAFTAPTCVHCHLNQLTHVVVKHGAHIG